MTSDRKPSFEERTFWVYSITLFVLGLSAGLLMGLWLGSLFRG
jgi:hypothetical protein